MNPSKFAKFHNQFVTVYLKGTGGEIEKRTGEVTNTSSEGIVLSYRGATRIISASIIDDIRITRVRLATRVIKIFDERDDVRQHLLDRHGLSLIICKTITPEDAFIFHGKIDHSDLGHKHTNSRYISEDAETAMEELG